MAGYLIPVMATMRTWTATGGNVRPVPLPPFYQKAVGGTVWTSTASNIHALSLTVTAPKGNSGTIYIDSLSSACPATRREQTMIGLTAGQSFTFTGVPLGSGAYREITFGTGVTYLHASATSQRAVITYYKQSRT